MVGKPGRIVLVWVTAINALADSRVYRPPELSTIKTGPRAIWEKDASTPRRQRRMLKMNPKMFAVTRAGGCTDLEFRYLDRGGRKARAHKC